MLIFSVLSGPADAEQALYNALATLGVGADALPQVQRSPDEVFERFDKHSASLVRTERMAAWARLPLNHSAGQQDWWRETHGRVIVPDQLPEKPPPNNTRQKAGVTPEDTEALSQPGPVLSSYSPFPDTQQLAQLQSETPQSQPQDQSQRPDPTLQLELGLSTAHGATSEDNSMVDPALSHNDGNLSLASAANEAVNNLNGKRSLEDGTDYGQRPNPSRKYF